MIENRDLFDRIAKSLIADYVRIYLVNVKTNKYSQYYINQGSNLLTENRKGDDFFCYIAEGAGQEVYEEDKHFFQNDNLKEKLLKQFRKGNRQSFVYRLVENGKKVYYTMKLIHEWR